MLSGCLITQKILYSFEYYNKPLAWFSISTQYTLLICSLSPLPLVARLFPIYPDGVPHTSFTMHSSCLLTITCIAEVNKCTIRERYMSSEHETWNDSKQTIMTSRVEILYTHKGAKLPSLWRWLYGRLNAKTPTPALKKNFLIESSSTLSHRLSTCRHVQPSGFGPDFKIIGYPLPPTCGNPPLILGCGNPPYLPLIMPFPGGDLLLRRGLLLCLLRRLAGIFDMCGSSNSPSE